MNQEQRSNEKSRLSYAFYAFMSQKSPVLTTIEQYPLAYTSPLSSHDYPQFWLCLDGGYIHRVNGTDIRCERGTGVIVPPGVSHCFSIPQSENPRLFHLSLMYDVFSETPEESYINTISNLFLSPFEKALGHSVPLFVTLSTQSMNIAEELTQLLGSEKFRRDTPLSLRTIEQLFSLPEFALPDGCNQRAERVIQSHLRPIVRVLQYLNQHYPEKCPEEVLARVSSLGHTELYRRFRHFVGCTFAIYLQQLRVRRAQSYLMHTDYSISYISDICGFSGQAYMTMLYKKYLGITPKPHRIKMKQWLKEHPERKRNLVGL